MKTFTYDLYQKSYASMKEGCSYVQKDENGAEVEKPITVQGMHDIMDQTDRMIYWIKIPKVILQVLVAFCVFEFFMVFMHRSEALDKNPFDKIMVYRRVFGFLCIFSVWFCFRGIYTWDAHAQVEAIVDGQCTSDEMLLETFVQMRMFLDKSQSKEREIWLYLFLALIAAMNVLGFLYKKTQTDKEYAKQDKGQL